MWEVPHPGVLAVADAVLNPGALAVAHLKQGDISAGLVGDEARVPVAVLIEDRELRAGVRALASGDQTSPLRPRLKSRRSVSSATHAPSRSSPSPSSAPNHWACGTSRICVRIG